MRGNAYLAAAAVRLEKTLLDAVLSRPATASGRSERRRILLSRSVVTKGIRQTSEKQRKKSYSPLSHALSRCESFACFLFILESARSHTNSARDEAEVAVAVAARKYSGHYYTLESARRSHTPCRRGAGMIIAGRGY